MSTEPSFAFAFSIIIGIRLFYAQDNDLFWARVSRVIYNYIKQASLKCGWSLKGMYPAVPTSSWKEDGDVQKSVITVIKRTDILSGQKEENQSDIKNISSQLFSAGSLIDLDQKYTLEVCWKCWCSEEPWRSIFPGLG